MWTTNAEGVFESDLLKQLALAPSWLRYALSAALAGGIHATQADPFRHRVSLQIRSGCIGQGDALVTATPEAQIIGIRTADCVPILFADPQTASRSGCSRRMAWNGSARSPGGRWSGCEEISVPSPRIIYAAIGPSIGHVLF